jgi:hypothetical protein
MRQRAVRTETTTPPAEAEAHQIRAARNGEIDDPHRQLEIGRDFIGVRDGPYELCAECSDDAGEQAPASNPKMMNLRAILIGQAD